MENQNKKEVELLTASEAMLKYGLNWEVLKKDITVNGEVASDYQAIVRQDTGRIFQIAKNRYEPIQNKDAFRFFDEIVQTGQAKYTSARSYKGGAVIELTAKLPYDFEVIPGDLSKTFIRLRTSHDGSIKCIIAPYIERLVCSNGMTAFVRDYEKTVSVKHTINAEHRFLFNAKRTLEKEIEYFKMFAEHCKSLAKKQMTGLEVDSFLDKLFDVKYEDDETTTKVKNQIDKIKELQATGQGTDIPGVKGTAWGVYNSITEYIDNYRSTKGDSENRDYSANFGSGKNLREKAFVLLVK